MHEQFGTYGAWLNPALGDAPRIEYAPELEELCYQTICVGIGADPVGDMELLEEMIAATKHAIIATAIINMWQDDARSIAYHYHRIVDRYGPRLLLGIGLGHPETRDAYEKPYERMVHYVDALLDGRVPAEAIVIGALGTKTLTLAGEGSMSKLKASEVAVWATERAVQILGGAGYSREHPVQRWFRDAKIYTIFEGTSEIQRLVISRAISGMTIR